jgi:hypothetical protein
MINLIVILTMICGVLHGLSKLSNCPSGCAVYSNLFDFIFDIKQK